MCIQPDPGYDVAVLQSQPQEYVSGHKLPCHLCLLRIDIQLPVVTGIHQCANGKGKLLQGCTFGTYWQVSAYRGACIGIIQKIGDPLPIHNAVQDI